MKDTKPFLIATDFPKIRRASLDTLQVNLGYRCNMSCTHCHVNAGPNRTESMSEAVIELVLEFLRKNNISCLDLTGGAPELNPHFKKLVLGARELGVRVVDRCNLTILLEPGMESMAEFMSQNRVEITASLPCYQERNVSEQRGKGVFNQSIIALQKLNQLGYGERNDLVLNLVYNPNGPFLPPSQDQLEKAYKAELKQKHGIVFNQLLTITNMPISRFGSMLFSKGKLEEYLDLLKENFSSDNLNAVMCRTLISVDYQGFVYDCDFNQMLDIPIDLQVEHYCGQRIHLNNLIGQNIKGNFISVGEHCYGCTAGQGSSCSGALN